MNASHPELFHHLVNPHLVRATDPETSQQAAAAQTPQKLTSVRNLVFCALKGAADKGLTQEEICGKLSAIPPSSVRSRCCELRRDGYVEDSGERRRTRYGSAAVVWRLTQKDPWSTPVA